MKHVFAALIATALASSPAFADPRTLTTSRIATCTVTSSTEAEQIGLRVQLFADVETVFCDTDDHPGFIAIGLHQLPAESPAAGTPAASQDFFVSRLMQASTLKVPQADKSIYFEFPMGKSGTLVVEGQVDETNPLLLKAQMYTRLAKGKITGDSRIVCDLEPLVDESKCGEDEQ